MKLGILVEVTKNLFKKPITIQFPKESKTISRDYRGEHRWDMSKCIGCGICANACPNRAIEMVEVRHAGKTKKYPNIDMGKCCFCGLCQDICPTSAIKLSANLPSPTADPSSLIKKPIDKIEKTED